MNTTGCQRIWLESMKETQPAQSQEARQESAADLCERLRAMKLGPCNDAADFIERMAAQTAPVNVPGGAISDALQSLIEEIGVPNLRTRLRLKLVEYIRSIEARKVPVAISLLSELHALVTGECPSLLNEDSGGDGQLDVDIRNLLSAAPSAPSEDAKDATELADDGVYCKGCDCPNDELDPCRVAEKLAKERKAATAQQKGGE